MFLEFIDNTTATTCAATTSTYTNTAKKFAMSSNRFRDVISLWYEKQPKICPCSLMVTVKFSQLVKTAGVEEPNDKRTH